MAKIAFRVMKYEGDDMYSHAVFKSADVKGLRSPLVYGDAKPLVSGCTRREAQYYKEKFTKEANS